MHTLRMLTGLLVLIGLAGVGVCQEAKAKRAIAADQFLEKYIQAGYQPDAVAADPDLISNFEESIQRVKSAIESVRAASTGRGQVITTARNKLLAIGKLEMLERLLSAQMETAKSSTVKWKHRIAYFPHDERELKPGRVYRIDAMESRSSGERPGMVGKTNVSAREKVWVDVLWEAERTTHKGQQIETGGKVFLCVGTFSLDDSVFFELDEVTHKLPALVEAKVDAKDREPVSDKTTAISRTWTSAKGNHKIDAEVVRVNDDKIQLRKPDNKVIEISLSDLAFADRQWAKLYRDTTEMITPYGTLRIEESDAFLFRSLDRDSSAPESMYGETSGGGYFDDR